MLIYVNIQTFPSVQEDVSVLVISLICGFVFAYAKTSGILTNLLILSISICHSGPQHLSRLVGKPTMWFPVRSDTNRPVQAQKRARSLKFRIKVEEELYYPRSENKGAYQLRSYCEDDLCLCFRLCRLLVFPWGGSFVVAGFIFSLCVFILYREKVYKIPTGC